MGDLVEAIVELHQDLPFYLRSTRPFALQLERFGEQNSDHAICDFYVERGLRFIKRLSFYRSIVSRSLVYIFTACGGGGGDLG